VPSRGIIAVCDFGGSGTSLTLVDAANDYQPIAPTVRHADFSGDLIDQALLTHAVAELSSACSSDASATSAIGSLNQLRAACRHAKEELSSTTATTLTAEVPGYHGDIRITRTELDDAIHQPLDGFVAVIQEALQRSQLRVADLVAIASVGGGASIPAVTTTLSQHFRAPVITTPRPHMTAAIGAALRATRGAANNGETAMAPTAAGAGSLADATTKIDAVPESSPAAPLAWSEAAADGDDSDIVPLRAGEYPEQGSNPAVRAGRPQPVFDRGSPSSRSGQAVDTWYRRPVVLIVGTALVVLAVGAAIMIALRHPSGGAPSTPAPSVSTTPDSPAPADQSSVPSGATETQAPANSPPSSTESDTTAPSSTTMQAPTTTTTQAPTTTTQAPTTTTQAPATTQAPTTTQEPQPPVIPPIPRIPGIPRFLPQPEPGNG
jgi:cell division ATPase FtsA